MRTHHVQDHLSRPSQLADRFVREPDWPLRAGGSSFVHHVVALAGTLAPLLALVLAAFALVPVWRVWGRHRLAASGR